MENEVYSDQISPSHFMFIFFDHYSFRNTKNYYHPLVQLKPIFETMIPAYMLMKVNYLQNRHFLYFDKETKFGVSRDFFTHF